MNTLDRIGSDRMPTATGFSVSVTLVRSRNRAPPPIRIPTAASITLNGRRRRAARGSAAAISRNSTAVKAVSNMISMAFWIVADRPTWKANPAARARFSAPVTAM